MLCKDSKSLGILTEGAHSISNAAKGWDLSPLPKPSQLASSSANLPRPPTPMTLANAAYLGIKRFANDRNKENWANDTENDKSTLIRAVYKQVLGNQYIMASERLEGPESLFKRGYLSVREFVRQVAMSGLYKQKFFKNCNP